LSLRLTLQGNTPDELAADAVNYLLQRGYVVEMPGDWETPTELCRRIGISPRTFDRRMKDRRFMPQVDLDERGGRIMRLRSNSVFDKWIRPKRRRPSSFARV
jgi:hypothetical protein